MATAAADAAADDDVADGDADAVVDAAGAMTTLPTCDAISNVMRTPIRHQ